MKNSRFVKWAGVITMLLVIMSCSGSKNTVADRNGEMQASDNYKKLKQVVDTKNFTITADWAYPLGGNRVNLIGNTNYIKFRNDSVDAFLPYFGTVQVIANYGGDGGISFSGIPNDYKVNPDEDNENIKIQFEINNNSENFQIHMTLFPNKSANVSVNSSYRNSISYQGDFKEEVGENEN